MDALKGECSWLRFLKISINVTIIVYIVVYFYSCNVCCCIFVYLFTIFYACNALVLQMVCQLIKHNTTVHILGQTSKLKYEKNTSLATSSQQIFGQNSKIKYSCHEKLNKNLQVPIHMYKINSHNISYVRSWVVSSLSPFKFLEYGVG